MAKLYQVELLDAMAAPVAATRARRRQVEPHVGRHVVLREGWPSLVEIATPRPSRNRWRGECVGFGGAFPDPLGASPMIYAPFVCYLFANDPYNEV